MPATATAAEPLSPRDAARATTGIASALSGQVPVGSSQMWAARTNASESEKRRGASQSGDVRHAVSPAWIATNASGIAAASHGRASWYVPSTARAGSAIATARRNCGSRLRRTESRADHTLI